MTQQKLTLLLEHNPSLSVANTPVPNTNNVKKYRNKPCWTMNGDPYHADDEGNSARKAGGDWVFHSQGERRRWQELVFLQEQGHIANLRLQVPLELIPTIR